MQLQLTGRLGADPEMRVSSNGNSFLTFSLAVRVSKDSSIWVDVIAFGENAKFIQDETSPSKGDLVMVYGRLLADSYEKEGQLFPKIKVEAKYVEKFYKRQEQSETKENTSNDSNEDLPF